MLTAPTIAMASTALPSVAHCQVSASTRERRPSRMYVTGLGRATVLRHGDNCSRGTYAEVRNRNGKNNKKLEFTAAGLPVFSAIAYPNPANARLHIDASATNTR